MQQLGPGYKKPEPMKENVFSVLACLLLVILEGIYIRVKMASFVPFQSTNILCASHAGVHI